MRPKNMRYYSEYNKLKKIKKREPNKNKVLRRKKY